MVRRGPITLACLLATLLTSIAMAQPEVRRHSPSDPPRPGPVTVPDTAAPAPPGPGAAEPTAPLQAPQSGPDAIPPPLQLSPFEFTSVERCEGFPQFACALRYRCADVETTTADTRFECIGGEGAQMPTQACPEGIEPIPTGRGYMCVVPF